MSHENLRVTTYYESYITAVNDWLSKFDAYNVFSVNGCDECAKNDNKIYAVW